MRLPTWIWLAPGNARNLSVTAASGPNVVTVAARLAQVVFNDLPASARTDATCTGGGRPYRPGARSDCWIDFRQPTPAITFSVSTIWRITVTGGVLLGDPTINRTSQPVTMAVAQTETLGGPGGH